MQFACPINEVKSKLSKNKHLCFLLYFTWFIPLFEYHLFIKLSVLHFRMLCNKVDKIIEHHFVLDVIWCSIRLDVKNVFVRCKCKNICRRN